MSMPNSPTQFGIHTNRLEFAMGLVVTSKKMSIFMLVTTASPVCTKCIIDLIPMHGHTPGTNTVLLITKMIGVVDDQNSQNMAHSLIHFYVHFNISVTHLVVITQVSSHSVGSHQGLHSVHAKQDGAKCFSYFSPIH